MHRRNQEAQILGELLAHALDPRQQLAALVAVHQRDQPIADLQAHQIDRIDVLPAQLLAFRLLQGRQLVGRQSRHGGVGARLAVFLAPDQPGKARGHQAQAHEGRVRHTRHQADDDQQTRRHRQRLGRGEHLPVDLLAHVLGSGHAGDHDRRRGGQQQRGNLRHQAVADGQQGIDARRLASRQVVLQGTDGHATEQGDEHDQQAGDGVTAHEFAGTVHGTVEIGFLRHLGAALLGLALVDQAGVEVGVDGHLLARQGIQGEACAHFGDAPGALGDHHEVDDHQNGEHHGTDHVVTADHHITEGLDHLAGGALAFLAMQQHDAGGGDVQRQPQQRGNQQDGREHGEVERAQRIDADQQDDDGQGDVEREEHVEQERRHRQGHHAQQHQHQQRHAQIAPAQTGQVAAQVRQPRAIHPLLPLVETIF